MKVLAYFQSYTGTYNKEISELEYLYKSALSVEGVVGLVIATRPDCITDDVISLLERLNREHIVFVEFGAETSHDDTLRLINRNHTWEDLEVAVRKVASKGIHCGIHLIMGLPGENREMMLETVRKASALPIETLKLHQLQVLKNTILHDKLLKGEITVPDFSLEEYLDLCVEIIKLTPENIIIERFLSQSPPDLVVSPSWGLKNYQFMNKLSGLLDRAQQKK